jgi:hypothetical protein
MRAARIARVKKPVIKNLLLLCSKIMRPDITPEVRRGETNAHKKAAFADTEIPACRFEWRMSRNAADTKLRLFKFSNVVLGEEMGCLITHMEGEVNYISMSFAGVLPQLGK